MAIDNCENWSIYGGPGNEALLLNGVYADRGDSGGSFHADPDGISTGYVFRYDGGSNNSYNNGLRYILSSTQDIVGKAMRNWLTNLPPDNNRFPIMASFRDNTNLNILDIGFTSTGAIVARNHIAVENYTTAGPVVTANAWWHIEAKIKISTGELNIYVEGVNVLSVAGKNFGANPIAQEAFATQNNFAVWGGSAYAKDVVWWDGSGTQNTDILGSVLVVSLIPDADIALNWTPTPNTDAGYQILATAPPQDGSVYLDAPHPAPSPYVGAMTGLSGDITSVKCVMTMVRAAKTDGGDGSLQVGLISSPSSSPATTLGANRPITTAQTYWRDVFEIDPKTSAPWLPSAVDVVQLQLDRTA